MPNDHYISRFLTRRWEDPGTKDLRFYDFDRDQFDRKSSRNLFAKANVNTRETEKWLNRYIETPVSRYLDRVIGDDGSSELIDTGQKDLFRAFVGLTIIQIQRLQDAQENKTGDKTLNDWVSSGEPFLDHFATITAEKEALYGLTLPVAESPLFFPNHGFFVVPVIGPYPVLAVPLSPRHCVCTAPKGEAIKEQIQRWAHSRGTLSAFSTGVAQQTNKIVIPPSGHAAIDGDPEAFKAYLLKMRDAARNLFNLTGEASAVAGLRSWKVT